MLPRDPALLMRMREQISLELQQTQRMLEFISPNDTQTLEILKTQQAELSKQLRDITQQMQTRYQPQGLPTEIMPGVSGTPSAIQGTIQGTQGTQGTIQGMPPGMSMPVTHTQESIWRTPVPPMPAVGPYITPSTVPSTALPTAPGMPPDMYSRPVPMPLNRPEMPVPVPNVYNPPPYPNNAPWGDPTPNVWDMTPWGPKLPKELTDMKQSIEGLQQEVISLKETIRNLETQIQTLNRILLSEGTRNKE